MGTIEPITSWVRTVGQSISHRSRLHQPRHSRSIGLGPVSSLVPRASSSGLCATGAAGNGGGAARPRRTKIPSCLYLGRKRGVFGVIKRELPPLLRGSIAETPRLQVSDDPRMRVGAKSSPSISSYDEAAARTQTAMKFATTRSYARPGSCRALTVVSLFPAVAIDKLWQRCQPL